MERHGGAISAETEEGKGSTFSFTIPLEEKLIPEQEGRVEEFVQGLSSEGDKRKEEKREVFEKFVEGL